MTICNVNINVGGVPTLARRRRVRLVRASACFSRRWKSFGDMMAGEMKRRHRKLVTAMNFTFCKRSHNQSSGQEIHKKECQRMLVLTCHSFWWHGKKYPVGLHKTFT